MFNDRHSFSIYIILFVMTIGMVSCTSSQELTKIQAESEFEINQYINPQDFGYNLSIKGIEENKPADSSFTPVSVEGGMRLAFGQVRYPPEAMNNNIKGKVILEVYIDENGQLTAYRTIQSPHGLLLNAAVEAAKQWPYNPARLNQTPVASFIRIPINFRMYSHEVGVDG